MYSVHETLILPYMMCSCQYVLSLQGGSAEVQLKAGDTLILTTDEAFSKSGNSKMMYVDYKNILKVWPLTVGSHPHVESHCLVLSCNLFTISCYTNVHVQLSHVSHSSIGFYS